MRTIILTILLSIVTITSVFAQGGNTTIPIIIGFKGPNFSYMDTRNTNNYSNDFLNSSLGGVFPPNTRMVFYKFTLTESTEITISHIITDNKGSYIRVLNDKGITIESSGKGNEKAYLKKSFNAGTYFVTSQGRSINGEITTLISGYKDVPLKDSQLGSKSSSFEYTSTQNTTNGSNTWGYRPTNDVYYHFSLTKRMKVIVSHCGSGLKETCITLQDKKSGLDIFSCTNNGKCSSMSNGYIEKELDVGSYTVISEGATSNGSITTKIEGIDMSQLDIGSHKSSFSYTHTQDTKLSSNNLGNGFYDITYKLTTAIGIDLTISHCGSELTKTSTILLDANKKQIAISSSNKGECSSSENAFLKVENLSVGTYYVVSEGAAGNGKITTNIEGLRRVTPQGISANHNYIKSRTYTSDDGKQYLDVIQYLDDLGTPSQSVQMATSPAKDDIVSFQDRDSFGRITEDWLPITTSFKGAYIDPLVIKAIAKASTAYNDKAPFAKPVYDNSPLNRVIEQYGVGNDWHIKGKSIKTFNLTNKGTGVTEKTIVMNSANTLSGVHTCCDLITLKSGFQFKATDEKSLHLYTDPSLCQAPKAMSRAAAVPAIRDEFLMCSNYQVFNGKLTKKPNYRAGELYVTLMVDEDDNKSLEFKNKLDQTILTRQINGAEKYDTNYVYDDLGNLCYVLPPLAVDKVANHDDSNEFMKQYAYIYKYDNRNRCTQKKLPGIEPIFYVYDKADQLIFSQDGEQRLRREGNKSEWTFNKYDALGRLVISGIYKTAENRDNLEKKYKDIVVKEKAGSGDFNYSWTTLAGEIPNKDVLLVNYYDNYDYMPNQWDYYKLKTFNTKAGFGKQHISAKGMLVGSRIKNIDAAGKTVHSKETEIAAVMHYDNRGRLIQVKSTNHLGGTEEEYIAYNFTGQPTQRLHIHTGAGNTTTELYTYTYDHAGRLKDTKHKLNTGVETLIASNTYDNLGRFQTNTKGGNELNTSYTYNIRSWTKSIDTKKGNTLLFNQTLYYNDAVKEHTYSDYQPSYSGNVSGMAWQLQGEAKRSNRFKYDGLSRLTHSAYNGVASGGNYNTSYNYDKHGNITQTVQNGLKAQGSYAQVSNLAMSYNGNQLNNVHDTGQGSNLSTSAHFQDYSKDATKAKKEYSYNTNGAMTQDLNKGISSIQYNSLNLPTSMDIKSPLAEARNEYTYSAGGQKLRVVQKWNPNFSTAPIIGSGINVSSLTVSKTTDYVGNKIYEDKKLKRILIDGGYIEFTNGNLATGKYNYYLTDHLGNNRAVAEAGNNILAQKTHYYPFGMAFAEGVGQEKQPFKYNGKELDSKHGLNTYDYSARYMDPAIGRFTSVDPHAENYYSWSPYAYVGNNPMRLTDPTGMDWYYFNEKTGEYERKEEAEGQHRMAVRSIDKIGNTTYTFHDFNDPKEDAKSIDNGDITSFTSMSLDDVESIMNDIDVGDQGVLSRWGYAAKESNANNLSGEGQLDFRATTPQVMGNNTLRVINGTAYNGADAGNYLWGYAMRKMGYSELGARTGAHMNAWWSAKQSNGEGSTHSNSVVRWFQNRSWSGDSAGDQRAIKKGMQDSGSYWKYVF